MNQSALVKELTSIVGESNVKSAPDELSEYSIDGKTPKAVLFPENESQISEILKFATRDSVTVTPMGSGTKRSFGNIPGELNVVLSTNNLNRVLGHEVKDLVATTECGVSLSELQNKLSENNQFLPVNPMHVAKGATLGGVIATNASGPLRLRYGTLRELLIGIRVVRGDGTVFKGGAKVVKNVAGYDLPKLFVGSFGTLGVITEATLRLYALPERSETYLVSFTTLEKCSETVSELIKSDLVLNSLELLNPLVLKNAAERSGVELKRKKYGLVIRVMNVDKAVSEQMALVVKVCNKARGVGVSVSGEQEESLWEEIINCPGDSHGEDPVRLKAGVLLTEVAKIFHELDTLAGQKKVKVYASAKAANGIVDIGLIGDPRSVIPLIKELRQSVSSSGGSLVIESAPPEVKSAIDVWGDMGPGLTLMNRIKTNFDPAGILTPGRFIE